MKRKVTLLIALAFCTSCAVAGCGSVSNETSEPKEVSVSVTETNSEENETQNSEEVTAEETTAEEEEPAFSFTAKNEIKNADITSGYVQIFNDIFRNGGYITVADFSSQYGDSWDCSNLSRIDQGRWYTISVVHKETGLKMTLFTYQIPEGEVILKFIPQGDTWNYSWMPGGLSSLGFREELEGFSEKGLEAFADLYEKNGFHRAEKDYVPLDSIPENTPDKYVGTYSYPQKTGSDEFLAVYEISDINLFGYKPIVTNVVHYFKDADFGCYNHYYIRFRDGEIGEAKLLNQGAGKLSQWD